MVQLYTSLLISIFLLLPLTPAWRVSAWLFPNHDFWRRAFLTACLYPLIVSGVLFLLHPFGLLTARGVATAMVLLNVISLFVKVEPSAPFRQLYVDGADRIPMFLATAFIFAACLFQFIKLYFHGSTLFSDDLAYHFVTVTGWMRSGSLSHPLIAMGSYYPFNPHLLSFYLTLPTGNIRWTWLASVFWSLLAMASIIRLGSTMGSVNRAHFMLVASVFAFSGSILWMTRIFCSSDLAGASALIAAAVYLVPTTDDTARDRNASLLVAGLMCGFAIGTKPTYLVPAAVLLLGALVLPMLRDRLDFGRVWRASIRPAMILGGAVFFTGSFWYIRNLIISGNPLFPIRSIFFSGPIRSRHIEPTVLATYLFKQPFDPAVWSKSILSLLDWPLVSGIVAFLGLLLACIYIAALLWSGDRQRNFSMLENPMSWIVLSAVAMFAMHIFSPFSGSTLDGSRLMVFSRYIVYVFIVGLLALAWMLSLGSRPVRVVGCVLLALVVLWHMGIAYDRYPLLMIAAVVMGLGASIVYSVFLLNRRAFSFSMPAIPAFLGLTLVTLLLVGGREFTAKEYRLQFDIHPGHEAMVEVMKAIDTLPEGSRVAQFSPMVWEFGYLYGSHAQHELVFIDQNGLLMSELHVAHKERRIGGPTGHPTFGLQVHFHYNQPDKVAANTLAAGVEYLLVTKYSFDEAEWPPQRDGLRKAGLHTLVWENGHSEIYASPGVPNPFAEDWN
ncbi:MAG: hypothetical protein JJU11_09225 [Candidatus Sumerlaeia bacterium]|nr:hypothetical protein [Candidatus Sumerlaeia bacterium]